MICLSVAILLGTLVIGFLFPLVDSFIGKLNDRHIDTKECEIYRGNSDKKIMEIDFAKVAYM